jgi:amino-acid N-acetyltransferase
MPRLYIEEYARHLVGKRVCIACREGILRDNLAVIVADIKFLARKDIDTTLFHNLPNRSANQKFLQRLSTRLSRTRVVRIEPNSDFYQAVLDHPDSRFKIIFLERRYLVDNKGYKINALTTDRVRESLPAYADCIGNVNFKDSMNHICRKIEEGYCDRVHILPAGKNTIKHELFTVEGSGTMIANNFVEQFRRVETDEDVAIVNRILTMYKKGGFLKPRSKRYISQNRNRFFVTIIDGIAVGCIEQKIIDENTVELGALAISTRFRSQRIGVFTVNAFLDLMIGEGFTRFISLTRNPRLKELFNQLGFVEGTREEYRKRQEISPDVPMFYKSLAV